MVHLIWSQDEFAAEELAARLVARAGPEAEVVPLEAAASEVPGLREALSAQSLFASARVVVVKGAERLTATGAAAVADLAATASDEELVLVAVSERQPAALTKALDGVAEMHKFAKPKRAELVKLVERRMRNAGVKPAPGAAVALIDAVGSGLRELAGAVEQLATRAGTGAQLSPDDVAAHFRGSSEQPFWALFDALCARDGAAAYRVLHALLAQGQDPIPVVVSLASQGRAVLRTQAFLARHPGAADGELARALGVSAGRAGVLRRQAGRLPTRWLEELHRLCAAADVDLKGGEEGAAPPADVVLERLVGLLVDAA